jgi:tetratricopeptide (TPR) repeat protein
MSILNIKAFITKFKKKNVDMDSSFRWNDKLSNVSFQRKRESRKTFIVFFGNLSSIICLVVAIFLFIGCGFGSSESPETYNNYAIKSAKMGLWNEAIIRWKHLVDTNPNDARFHNNLAVAYEAKNELDLALSEYEKATKLDPKNKVYSHNYIRFKIDYDKLQKRGNTKTPEEKT